MCGGFVGDILDDIGDAISDTTDYLFHGGLEDDIKEIGRDFDDFVRDTIPGGWAGVAGLSLLAVGIANPSLLGLAEGGALTTEALTAAGLDAAAVAEGIAAVAPEVLAATEAAVASGIAPEIIAMANATLDPIAALNAAQGWTIADTAYLASIGAPEALIATATANNAALAAAETAATGATEGAATGAADGGTTQIFDDGSTLTTNADGTITSVDTNGVSQTTQFFDDGSTLTTGADGNVISNTPATDTGVITGGTPDGLPPVEDAVPSWVNPNPTPDPTLGTALGNYAGAVYDTLGPLGTAALLGGGAALASNLTGGSATGGPDNRTVNYEWGQATPLQTGPLNPGLLQQAASQPFYQTTNPTDAQFYWGARNVVNKPEDIANFNNIPGAPETPWGAGKTAVGGQLPLNVPNFVNQYITNPALAGVMSGTGQGLAPQPAPQPAVMPPMSMAQQAIAAKTSGGPTIPGAVIEQPMIPTLGNHLYRDEFDAGMPSYFNGAPGAQLSLPGPVVPV